MWPGPGYVAKILSQRWENFNGDLKRGEFAKMEGNPHKMRLGRFNSGPFSLLADSNSSDVDESGAAAVEPMDVPLNGDQFLLRTEGEVGFECTDIAMMVVFGALLCGVFVLFYWVLAKVLVIEVEQRKNVLYVNDPRVPKDVPHRL